MKKRWYIVDTGDKALSWSVKKECGEEFTSRAAAVKRASALADSEPHKAFLVCEAVDLIVVETKPVKRVQLR